MADKVVAKPDGKDTVTISVFVKDENNIGIVNKAVNIKGVANLNIKIVSGMTDNQGKAVFEINSKKIGKYTIIALVEEIPLEKELTVVFGNYVK